MTASGNTDLNVEIENEDDPGPEVKFSARVDYAKACLFRYVQDLQSKGKKERQAI